MRQCCIFAGIHDFEFQDEINEDFADLADWTVDITGGTTWSVATGALVVTGAGAAIWYEGIHNTTVGPSFLASFDLVAGNGAFVFRGKSGANDCYIAWWDAGNCGFARVDNAKASTDLIKMPYGISSPARVQVEVSWKLDSVDDSRKWLLMTLFVDGREFVAYAEDVGMTAYDWSGDGVGFAVTGANVLTVDNLTIQELHRVVSYLTIDPGVPIAGALAQAIGTTKVVYLVRFDGTLRAWIPGNRAVDWTVDANRDKGMMDKRVFSNTLTHVRSIGALHAVEYYADMDGERYMHRFGQSDDPNLMNEEEVYAEARRQVHEAEEARKPIQLMIEGQPLLETHDVINYAFNDYRVMSVQHRMARAKLGTVFTTVINGRIYAFV